MLQPPALPTIAALLSLYSTSHSPTHTHTHTHPNSSVQHENFRCCLVSCPSHTHRHRHSRKHRNLRAALALLSFTENLLLVCTHTHAHTSIYTHVHMYVYINGYSNGYFLLNFTVILESLDFCIGGKSNIYSYFTRFALSFGLLFLHAKKKHLNMTNRQNIIIFL